MWTNWQVVNLFLERKVKAKDFNLPLQTMYFQLQIKLIDRNMLEKKFNDKIFDFNDILLLLTYFFFKNGGY